MVQAIIRIRFIDALQETASFMTVKTLSLARTRLMEIFTKT